MKTRDETIFDLADHAQNQCEALTEKMEAVVNGYDAAGERDREALCGITRDRYGRSMLAFAEPGTTGQRTVVYVDAILALAKLLNGGVQVQDD
jgi:hypothetical protein